VAGVAVVTDSTTDLPHDLVESIGLRVVPLSVTFGDESLISGVTIDAATFYQRLEAASRLPTTSQPAPAWFEEAGLVVSGTYQEGRLVEIVELADHPWFVASQFHPEFKSRPTRPAPLFREFVGAALERARERREAGIAAAAVR
jgi:hypothetical protein